MNKIGIFGGTFDPIHNMHLQMAEAAFNQFDLEYVLMMPTPNPPHKRGESIVDIDDRCNMVKIALDDSDKLIFSDFELDRTGPVYSSDTIELFKNKNPDTEIYFIIGGDSLLNIDKWHEPERLLKKVTLSTAFRDGGNYDNFQKKVEEVREKYGCKVCVINMLYSDISSTEIRKKFICGMDISNDVPKGVRTYINQNNLYKDEAYYQTENIKNSLRGIQDKYRYAHTLGVAETAFKMAKCYGYDMHKAYLAGLLHDCAKSVPDNEKIQICEENNIEISDAEKFNPFLLHAKAGVFLAKDKYGIADEDILSSIRFHTTGNINMSLLEKIIFVADYIEPGRDKAPDLEILRKLAYEDIDRTVYLILRDTLAHLKERGAKNIDKNTVRAYDYYKKCREES